MPTSIEAAQQWCRQQLWQSDSPAADSRALLCYVLNKPTAYLMTWPEKALTDTQWQQLQRLVRQRQQGLPIAYLIGEREFWSLPLAVNRSTLIPRPDTETLVAAALTCDLPATARVLDLGTGTGAIALALKSERPDWQVTAVDQSRDAVMLARHNAERLDLTIDVIQSDWFSALARSPRFDLIVSNPPYIDADDPHLQQGDVRFEPLSALVSNQQGLADIRLITAQASAWLNDGGWLLIEHGWQQACAVVELLQQNDYKHINGWTDYGSVERVTGGQKAG